MLVMASQINLYEEMTALSAQMVEAARANDWEQLVTLEKSVSALCAQLRQQDKPNDRLSQAELERKAALIQRILKDDAEVRRHTEPWMEHVRQFLGGTYRKRQVDKAYGAGQF